MADQDEATDKANASEDIVETSSEGENLESTEKVETESTKPTTEEINSDYLEGDRVEGEEEDKVDYKKRYGDSTREYQTLKVKSDQVNQVIANLERLVEANPKILEEIEEAKRLSGTTSTNPDNSTLIKQEVDKALEPIRKVAQDLEGKERLEKVKVLAEFERKNPNLFEPKATREDKKTIRLRIGKVANALVETGMEFNEAVNRAYLVVNPKAAMQRGKDEAYLETAGEGQAGFSNQVSAEGKETKKTQYTKRELEIADKLDSTGKVKKAMLEEK